MFKISLKTSVIALALTSLLVFSCKTKQVSSTETATEMATENTAEDNAKLSVPFEKYELENGLDVILHQDKSDPIVSIAIQYGVGS
ncbi:MAG TPA: hypothetical protein DCX41_10180, partial [Aequorivita sp.]|nr:hypothetical protein [Aequorivita sp.]